MTNGRKTTGHLGYKKVQGGYIAVLQIVGETNEGRAGVVCPETAKFRTAAARVLRIYHPHTGQQVKEAAGLYDGSFIYRVGKIARPEKPFEKAIEKVCGNGIHYFRSLSPALQWQYNLVWDGPRRYTMRWHDNGRLATRCTFNKQSELIDRMEFSQRGVLTDRMPVAQTQSAFADCRWPQSRPTHASSQGADANRPNGPNGLGEWLSFLAFVVKEVVEEVNFRVC